MYIEFKNKPIIIGIVNFHKDIFLHNLEIPDIYHNKAIRSGQPHNPIVGQLQPYYDSPKENTIMWPHRYNEDKQPEIIENLDLSPYYVLLTQKLNLSKEEYYEKLGRAKAVFSCSLHENLGISMMEGCLAGAIPIVPDRASYSEMYKDVFKYPSVWTESYGNYLEHKEELEDFIITLCDNYDIVKKEYLDEQVEVLTHNFLSADIMFDNILEI